MVTWDTTECIERNGIITGYAIEFNGTTVPEEVVGENFTASGLTPARNYIFRVAGINANGTGPFTNATIVSTDEDSMFITGRFSYTVNNRQLGLPAKVNVCSSRSCAGPHGSFKIHFHRAHLECPSGT
jgi:hypothetical protein